MVEQEAELTGVTFHRPPHEASIINLQFSGKPNNEQITRIGDIFEQHGIQYSSIRSHSYNKGAITVDTLVDITGNVGGLTSSDLCQWVFSNFRQPGAAQPGRDR